MALDAVVESVLATSKEKVAQITSEADQEVARALNEARERAAEIKSRKKRRLDTRLRLSSAGRSPAPISKSRERS